jgi:hypothetical protein
MSKEKKIGVAGGLNAVEMRVVVFNSIACIVE